jgi:hypothetical protein
LFICASCALPVLAMAVPRPTALKMMVSFTVTHVTYTHAVRTGGSDEWI